MTVGAASMFVLLLWRPVITAVSSGAVSASGLSFAFWLVVTAIVAAAVFFDYLMLVPGIALTEGLATVWKGFVSLLVLSFDVPIRNAVWGFLKSLGLGLNGAPQRAEDIAVSLMFEPSDPEDCVYLELPEEIVSRVTETQKSRLIEVQEILYRRSAVWSPTQLREELESVDFPLVHTTYYRDPECIQKVADWTSEKVGEPKLDGQLKIPTTVTRPMPAGFQQGFREEILGVNAYRWHVEELKKKHGAQGTRWGTGTNFRVL